jgi:acetyl-CoA carboxylase biotin carboxyl carrier protein
MDIKEIQELIKMMSKNNITEFKYSNGETKFTIRTKDFSDGAVPQYVQAAPQMMAMPAPAQAAPAAIAAPSPSIAVASEPEAPAVDSTAGLIEIKSPMVGTFYRSAGPDKPTYASVGDTITAGKVVCIVEAMKLFNEIESEVSGKIVKVCINDASPVEYDQLLFLVDPKG